MRQLRGGSRVFSDALAVSSTTVWRHTKTRSPAPAELLAKLAGHNTKAGSASGDDGASGEKTLAELSAEFGVRFISRRMRRRPTKTHSRKQRDLQPAAAARVPPQLRCHAEGSLRRLRARSPWELGRPLEAVHLRHGGEILSWRPRGGSVANRG